MTNIRSNNYSLDLKMRVIETYRTGKYKVSDISDMFMVSKSSVYNWIKLYNISKLSDKQRYIKSSSSLRNPKIRNIVLLYIQNNPNFIYRDLIGHIYEKTKIKISRSLLYIIIKDVGLSKKVAKYKKIYGDEDKLLNKKNALMDKFKKIADDKIISVDEVSFDTNITHRYGWSIKNTPIIKKIGATYERLTMICAVTNKKVISYKILKGSANAASFLDFLKNIHAGHFRDRYVFLDNAGIHRSKIVSEYVRRKNINLLFNVPYSPEFNPIEIVFSKLKKLVRDRTNNNLQSLTNNISNSIKHISQTNLKHFFSYSFSKLRY